MRLHAQLGLAERDIRIRQQHSDRRSERRGMVQHSVVLHAAGQTQGGNALSGAGTQTEQEELEDLGKLHNNEFGNFIVPQGSSCFKGDNKTRHD